MTFKKSSLAAGAALVLAAGTADATNGYFRLGYSANSIAMGGASTATAQDAMAGATNPALAHNVEKTFTLAASVFAPDRGFTVEGGDFSSVTPNDFPLAPQDTTSDSHYFVIPSFGYNRILNDDWAVNVNLYANGGMNTDYSESVFGAGETGVDLSQLFLTVGAAFKVTEDTHIGLSPVLGYQRFKAKGLANFGGFSQDATKLTDNKYDYATGYGARVGIWHSIDENWNVGASYQSEIQFEKFDKYSGLFAEDGSFNVPATYNVGLEFSRSNYAIALDYQHIDYSSIQSVGNKMLPNLMSAPLGSDGGAGFGWKDMGIIELGMAIEETDGDTYRFGVSYGEQPIPESEVLFNILAPGVQEWHFTAGYEFGIEDVDYAFTLMYSPPEKVSGENPMFQGQKVEIEMSQLELTFGANF